jgi:hypothetical protein
LVLAVAVQDANAAHYADSCWRDSTTDRTSYTAGDMISVYNVLIENAGSEPLDNVCIRFFLSADVTISANDDYPITGTWSWESFPALDSGIFNFEDMVIPLSTPGGVYYVGAIITIDGDETRDRPENDTAYSATPVFVADAPPNAKADPGAPVIVQQPMSFAADPGFEARFSVTATGALPLTYQWQKDSAPIPGATASVYSIAVVRQSDEGEYRCVVTNELGSVTSMTATLTVNDPPVIAVQPISQTVNYGAPANFVVVATGMPAPSYQWEKDGEVIHGANAATYRVSAARDPDAGSYVCVVRNSAGTASSDPATLTVTGSPSESSYDCLGQPVVTTAKGTGSNGPANSGGGDMFLLAAAGSTLFLARRKRGKASGGE